LDNCWIMGERQQAPLNLALTGPSSMRVARASCCVGVSLGGGLEAFGARAVEPIAAEFADPCRDGLLVHAYDQGHLCKALTVHDREDGEVIFDLAHIAEVLGSFQVALSLFTVGDR